MIDASRLSDSSGPTVARRWYAVQTLFRREAAAEAQLRRQSFETFLPLASRVTRHARQTRLVRTPVFPGYLFVKLDLAADRWRAINGTCGVARLVSAGDRPAAAPLGVVEALQHLVGPDGVIPLDDGLRPGVKVEVVTGPFATMIGELQRLDAGGRVRILLDFMGASMPIAVDRLSVRAA